MKLIIDRSKWLRGEGAEASYLLRSSDGKMCCLGFYGLACGLTPEEIAGLPAPLNLLDDAIKKVPSWLLLKNERRAGGVESSVHCVTLMSTNDKEASQDFDEQEREDIIKHTFALHGVEVEFIN